MPCGLSIPRHGLQQLNPTWSQQRVVKTACCQQQWHAANTWPARRVNPRPARDAWCVIILSCHGHPSCRLRGVDDVGAVASAISLVQHDAQRLKHRFILEVLQALGVAALQEMSGRLRVDAAFLHERPQTVPPPRLVTSGPGRQPTLFAKRLSNQHQEGHNQPTARPRLNV